MLVCLFCYSLVSVFAEHGIDKTKNENINIIKIKEELSKKLANKITAIIKN